MTLNKFINESFYDYIKVRNNEPIEVLVNPTKSELRKEALKEYNSDKDQNYVFFRVIINKENKNIYLFSANMLEHNDVYKNIKDKTLKEENSYAGFARFDLDTEKLTITYLMNNSQYKNLMNIISLPKFKFIVDYLKKVNK